VDAFEPLIGTRVGPYEIRHLIGRGGMGEVYLARDTSLNRDVAVKVLPDRYRLDADRLTRFDREAQVLASLNHPNIATLYGRETSAGVQALVMELVEGETLGDALSTGAFPRERTLRIAEQIVDALAAAHARGIVHRDLKPDNVKVRPDGTVKVLDFGLAKGFGNGSGAPSLETLTVTSEQGGFLLGTVAYMSPEQIRGLEVDTRTDVWSFGCVLYEMLAGRPPFSGKTQSDTIASVLGSQPDDTLLPVDTPSATRQLLERCLQKDRERRLQHIGDARFHLDESRATPRAVTSSEPRLSAARRRTAMMVGAALGFATLAALGSWYIAGRVSNEARSVVRLSIASMERPFPAPFGEHHLAISEDGIRVAYASTSHLLIRRMDQRDGVTLDIAAANPFFSPDGQWVGFFERAGDLKKVPAGGGTPVTIATITGRPNGATWRADGSIVFATSEGLFQVSEDGGSSRLLARPRPEKKERAYASPQYMPDGRSVLFTIVPESSAGEGQIAVLDLSSRSIRVVVPRGSSPRYTPTGHLVFVAAQTLTAVGFDVNAAKTLGEPVAIPDIPVATARDNGAADFALSKTGTLLFIMPNGPGSARPSTLSWRDRQGTDDTLGLTPGFYLFPRISPDGTRIALDIPGSNRDVWLWHVGRPRLTRLTTGAAEDMLPTWSRDGRIFFASQRNGNFDLYSQPADGATPERLEFAGPGDQMPNGFTPDGTQLIVNENFKDLSVLTLSRPPRLEPLLHSPFNEWLGEVSPDGKWIAYEADESGGQFEVFLRPYPRVTDRREQVSVHGGRYPMWSRTGRNELFYTDLNGAFMSVTIRTSPALSLGPATRLFDVRPPPRVITARPYDMSSDGKFLMLRPVALSTDQSIDISVILNWHEDLKRLPTDTASRSMR